MTELSEIMSAWLLGRESSDFFDQYICCVSKMYFSDMLLLVIQGIASHARVSARSWAGGCAPVHPHPADLNAEGDHG